MDGNILLVQCFADFSSLQSGIILQIVNKTLHKLHYIDILRITHFSIPVKFTLEEDFTKDAEDFTGLYGKTFLYVRLLSCHYLYIVQIGI